ncbi:hypothetical protein [Alkalisalibacterium limincola]|uniref:Uncharacterized protein n=1 Tax=Alkalisalibacterium limincola TaxID=2699169 RepID=A0A5C8L071_9GAMM|nr:hypothetical protein [Alkalisalibacterium limincola]TXK65635.1 hypothetical protein FU658_00425 [Alkalisalibacterium limincola]
MGTKDSDKRNMGAGGDKPRSTGGKDAKSTHDATGKSGRRKDEEGRDAPSGETESVIVRPPGTTY